MSVQNTTRRDFLKMMAAGAVASTVGWRPLGQQAWAAPPTPVRGKRLVVVLLRGAVDGLSILVPHAEAGYRDRRPSIAIASPGKPGGALALTEGFGLHPAMTAMHQAWAKNELAFFPASGTPKAVRSHFEAQALLESGTTDGVRQDGWLNRLATALGAGPGEAAGAVVLGDALPLILTGTAPVAFSQGRAGSVASEARSPLARPGASEWLRKLYATDPQMGPLLEQALSERQRLSFDLAAIEAMEANADAPPPEAAFAQDAHALGSLLRADAGLRLAFVALGGWDTHVRQGGAQGILANRLKALSEGLAAMAQGLGPVWSDTVVVVVSEFGRTVAENGGGGTDHGHGTPLWLLGGRVQGGRFFGLWPGLESAQLHEGRDVAVSVDRRAVLAGVLQQHMGLDFGAVAKVFPGIGIHSVWRRSLFR